MADPKKSSAGGYRWRQWTGRALLMAALTTMLVGLWVWRMRPPLNSISAKWSATSVAHKQASDAVVFGTYASSPSCQECHPAAFELWKDSHHALAERPLETELDRPAFDPPRSFRHAT